MKKVKEIIVKIDIFLKHLNGFYQYECSTTQSKTCKEAKQKFLLRYSGIHPDQVKASKAMGGR